MPCRSTRHRARTAAKTPQGRPSRPRRRWEVVRVAASGSWSPGPSLAVARIVEAGEPIGINQSGLTTNVYTVITDANGWLVTMFPGLPSR